jgi:hypothetical protein
MVGEVAIKNNNRGFLRCAELRSAPVEMTVFCVLDSVGISIPTLAAQGWGTRHPV